MAKKKYKLAVTVGVHDASQDRPEVRDGNGNIILPASKGVRYITAGDVVELDEKEGDALLARHGGFEERGPVPLSGITVSGEHSATVS